MSRHLLLNVTVYLFLNDSVIILFRLVDLADLYRERGTARPAVREADGKSLLWTNDRNDDDADGMEEYQREPHQ